MKIFAVVTAYMHHLGHSLFPYLDDWPLVEPSCSCLLATIQTVHTLLVSLWICLNEEKSILIPICTLTFIGARLDSVAARTFLPMDCCAALTSLIAVL